MNSSLEPAAGDAKTWLEGQLAEGRRLVDSALRRRLPAEDERPQALHKAMRYAVLGKGKRLRPILALVSAEACGGEAAQALPAAVAVELVHCYSLVHDDLPAMDDDDLRRGRPTCHKVFGEAMAILAGDALLTLAFEVLTQQVEEAALSATLVSELARAAGHGGMVGGQAADILAEGLEPSPESLDYIHSHKTGALISASVRMGALSVGAAQQSLQALTTYGQRVGLAFQIADDCLDVTSSAQELGKATQKDMDRGKLTYPALVGLEEARHAARRLAEEAVASLEGFGPEAKLLRELARFVVGRQR